jgi:hypothetical protein
VTSRVSFHKKAEVQQSRPKDSLPCPEFIASIAIQIDSIIVQPRLSEVGGSQFVGRPTRERRNPDSGRSTRGNETGHLLMSQVDEQRKFSEVSQSSEKSIKVQSAPPSELIA